MKLVFGLNEDLIEVLEFDRRKSVVVESIIPMGKIVKISQKVENGNQVNISLVTGEVVICNESIFSVKKLLGVAAEKSATLKETKVKDGKNIDKEQEKAVDEMVKKMESESIKIDKKDNLGEKEITKRKGDEEGKAIE